ncbi:MAG: DNA replication and repair protein RecF [Bacteroidaceae bacterium]|nr:DNA replication and repair protein RecF [Bacteroidaceae bacterium]
MKLLSLSLMNYRNIGEATLSLSPNVNCIVGHNGMGKTNILDSIFYLSFCKGYASALDDRNIKHGEDFFMIRGDYQREDGGTEQINISLKRGGRKSVKRDEKAYRRLSEHLGRIPLVLIAPADEYLVRGGAEERRRFMDMVIAQYDSCYIEALNRYEASLKQRNAMLKAEQEPDWAVMDIVEAMMSTDADYIYQKRQAFIKDFLPIFQMLYARLCATDTEQVSVAYDSHLERGNLEEQLLTCRDKERIVGHTLHGVHRDDINLLLGGHPLRYEGSQGQTKTYVIAMKLAQFLFLKEKGCGRTPILLLDDIFDKLDSKRVMKIMEFVSSNEMGQIFITDTNRENIDKLIAASTCDYKLFVVDEGVISEK